MNKWIDWQLREPKRGEAAFTIFKNLDNGFYYVFRGTSAPISHGSFSCGHNPIAWYPMPKMPQKYRDLNDELEERRKSEQARD